MRVLLPVVATLALGAAAAPAQASTCHDATSSYSHLRSVSCGQAKQVVARARAALLADEQPPFLPECKGDPVATWHGWRFTAVGTLGIDIVVTKGAKRFHFGGGGACG